MGEAIIPLVILGLGVWLGYMIALEPGETFGARAKRFFSMDRMTAKR